MDAGHLLGRLPGKEAWVATLLAQLLQHPIPVHTHHDIIRLALQGDATRALPVLAHVAKSPHAMSRRWVVRALPGLLCQHGLGRELLAELAQDPDPSVRAGAIVSMIELAPSRPGQLALIES
jgi:hypothetical protein